jgi:hypothetical protein
VFGNPVVVACSSCAGAVPDGGVIARSATVYSSATEGSSAHP